MPKVSVIIPVYNVERYLGECLDSILGQTLEDIEVVCVDDGSADASPEILADYAARDPRVRVVRQENAGSGAARNRALEMATGDAVVFMDPDDYYPSSDTLERLFAALSESGLNLAGGAVRRVPEDDPRAVKFNANFAVRKKFPHGGRVMLSEYQSPFFYCRFIYRRSFLEKHGFRFPLWRRFQDPPFLARILIAAGSFWAIDDCVYCHRLPEPGKSVDWMADDCLKLRAALDGFSELLDIARAAGCQKMYHTAVNSLARAHRLDNLAVNHPLWKDIKRLFRRLRHERWLRYKHWDRIFSLVYGDDWGRGHWMVIVRLLGLRGGLGLYRRWRRQGRRQI